MPAADLIQRFRSDIEALTGGAPETLCVAVSGGPDSVALLLLACAAYPGRVHAATVDHRLRPDSAEEARLVAEICAGLGVPHAILASPDAPAGASLQAQARALRYRLLCGWAAGLGARWLATGHHLDDQAETVLMRLARGAGVAGLAAVRRSRVHDGVALVRPLLGWRRADLARIVAQAGIEPVDDPSNRSDDYDRTRFRRLLGETELLPAERLAASASHFADADEALAWTAEREWRARATQGEGTVALDPDGLPAELLRRLASRAVDEVSGKGDWRRDKLADALAKVAAGGRATIAGVQISGGGRWRFEQAPPRRTDS